jgi:hypothetical protein
LGVAIGKFENILGTSFVGIETGFTLIYLRVGSCYVTRPADWIVFRCQKYVESACQLEVYCSNFDVIAQFKRSSHWRMLHNFCDVVAFDFVVLLLR